MPDATTLPTPPARRVRRLWLPVVLILLPVAARVLVAVAGRYDLGENAVFMSMMAFQMAFVLALFGVGVWFFVLSGITPRIRIGAGVALVALAAAAVAAVDRVEFDGQMTPRPYFRWEPTPEQRLADHRAAAAKADAVADLTVGPTDSPSFRGRHGDGITPNVLLADWTARPPRVLWKQPAGGGHAGFAVAGNSAVTIEQVGDEEGVVCYDRATGRERWKHAYPAKFTQSEPMGGNGPRATPAIADGDVYSLGATGELVCLNGADGRPKWRVNILADNDADNVDWGMTGSPLVVGRLVVVNPGARRGAAGTKAVAAYDRATGAKVWAAGTHRAAYASPLVATLGGREQVLALDAGGLAAYDPADGKPLWAFPWKTPMDMNSAQPLVVGPNRVLVSSEKDKGAAVIELAEAGGAWTVTPVWTTRKYAARYACPVLFAGHVFGLTDGRLICLDAATGAVRWKDGSFGNGQILLAGNKLVVTNERGRVHLVTADPAEFREVGSVDVFADRTWNMPALAGNQLFVRNHHEMACLELPTIPPPSPVSAGARR